MTSPDFERRYNNLVDAISLLHFDGYELSASLSYDNKQVFVNLTDLDGDNRAMQVTTIDLEN